MRDMVDICTIKTAVKLCLTMMGCVRDRCRCCFSPEALEALQPPILDILKLIRISQDVKIDDYPTEACFKCHNLLKEVHRFRRKCHAVDEIFRNNLQDVKHEVELILQNADNDDFSVVDVKKELLVEFEESEHIDVQIDKVEPDSESDGSQDRFGTYSEDPLVLVNKTDCPTDNLLIELNEQKLTNKKSAKKKTKTKLGVKTIKKDTIGKVKSTGKVAKEPQKRPAKKPYECEICSIKSRTPSALEIHLRTHSGEKPIACELCDYKCGAKNTLKIHMRNKHSDNRPFACDQCDYRSKGKASLLTHKKQHTAIKDYICELCPYSTFEMVNLKYHIRSAHTGERPYVCDRCPFRTMRPETLRIHIKWHDNYKKISCSQCSYVTSHERSLKEHMTRHTGNKIQCSLCSGSFTVKKSYKRHLIKQHGISPDKVQNMV